MNDPCNPCVINKAGSTAYGEFYGPGATEFISPPFDVFDRPIILDAIGLEAGVCLSIEQVFGCGLGEDFSPVLDQCGKCVKISNCCPQQIIILSGRYRLVLKVPAGSLFTPANVTVYSRFSLGKLPEGGSSMSCQCEQAAAVAQTPLEIADAICGSTGAKTILQGCLVIPPSGAAGGVLSGTYPNPTLNPIAAADSLSASSTAVNTLATAIAGNAAAANALAATLGPILDASDTVIHGPTLVGNGTAASPLDVSPTGVVAAINAQAAALNALAAALGPIIGASSFPTAAPPIASAPSVGNNNTTPTQFYGTNSKYLGEPTGFLNIGGFKVPHYA